MKTVFLFKTLALASFVTLAGCSGNHNGSGAGGVVSTTQPTLTETEKATAASTTMASVVTPENSVFTTEESSSGVTLFDSDAVTFLKTAIKKLSKMNIEKSIKSGDQIVTHYKTFKRVDEDSQGFFIERLVNFSKKDTRRQTFKIGAVLKDSFTYQRPLKNQPGKFGKVHTAKISSLKMVLESQRDTVQLIRFVKVKINKVEYSGIALYFATSPGGKLSVMIFSDAVSSLQNPIVLFDGITKTIGQLDNTEIEF